MNELILKDSRSLSLHMGETVYVGDNRITKLTVTLPDTIGGYPRAECQIELRAYIGRDEFLSYSVVSAEAQTELRLENDLTDAARNVELTMIITHNGNVIGRTNTVTLTVTKAKDGGEELTPRGQFDAVISAQRDTIAQQAATIAEQTDQLSDDAQTISGLNTQIDELEAQHAQTVSGLNAQISELEDEIDELETENTRLENLTETQRETIQQMIDNPPTPELYTPPVVTPSGQVQQITAPQGYDGLSECTVDRVTADVDNDIQPENIKEGVNILGVDGTYNPFPEHSVGGIYITEVDEDGYPKKVIIKDYEHSASSIGFLDTSDLAKTALKSLVVENCPNITSFSFSLADFTKLNEVIFPENFKSIFGGQFQGCMSLTRIEFPSSVNSISAYAFAYCSNLSTVINIPPNNTYGDGYYNTFSGCSNLLNVTLGQNFNSKFLNLSVSTRYSVETIVSWLDALKDRTGETAYTLTIGTTNLNKLTAEQIAIATAKNWNLA